MKPVGEGGLPALQAVGGRPWVGSSRVPRYLGIDEVAMVDRKAEGQAHMKLLRTVMVDLESGGLVDFLMDNRKSTIAAWFAGLEVWERSRIQGVSIDMNSDYRALIRVALPDVAIVIDRFHVDKMAQEAADMVRRVEVQSATAKAMSGDRNRLVDDDVRMFARMLRSRKLPRTPERREQLREYLRAHPFTYYATLARQQFRDIFENARNIAEARKRLRRWADDLHGGIRPAFAPSPTWSGRFTCSGARSWLSSRSRSRTARLNRRME